MTGVVSIMGHSVGALPALLAIAVAAVGLVIAVRTAITWLTGVVYALAVRHAIFAVIASTGIGIETIVDGGLAEFLPALLAWIGRTFGVSLPTLPF